MSRPVLSLAVPTLRRTVVHHARPPRMPSLRSPHVPAPPKSSAGTSTPRPHLDAEAAATTSSSKLEGTSLTFHHSPPPTAPSYTTGVEPDLLRWVSGKQVQLTGEEAAPIRRASVTPQEQVEWTEDVVKQMRSMRADGRSRREIGEALSIPPEQRYLISRMAPLSKDQQVGQEVDLLQQKAGWGRRKTLHREIRERRKAFW